jgi:hypothetical protein
MADEAASQALSQLLEQLKSSAWDARVEAVQKPRDRSESPALEGLISVLYDENTAVVEIARRRSSDAATKQRVGR